MSDPPRLVATGFRLELSTGATHPCVLACDDAVGNAVGEYVVKLRSEVRGGPTGLAFELIAAQLASRLSIPVPSPALVEISRNFAEAIPNAAVRERLRKSVGLNFGTRFLTPGYVTWTVDDPIPVSLRQVAIEIMAFDALIDNSDRRRDKPNLLWKADELVVIDHELAFAFTRLVGTHGAPFEPKSLEFLQNHPLRAGLRHGPIDLRRFNGELEALKPREIDALCGGVPTEFGAEYVDRVADWLKRATKRCHQLEQGLRRVLQ